MLVGDRIAQPLHGPWIHASKRIQVRLQVHLLLQVYGGQQEQIRGCHPAFLSHACLCIPVYTHTGLHACTEAQMFEVLCVKEPPRSLAFWHHLLVSLC